MSCTRANLEKMGDKDLAVVLHHLENKQTTLQVAGSEIAKLRRQLVDQVERPLRGCNLTADLTRGTCVTRHTPHVTRHTSHVTRQTSHVTRHMSHVTSRFILTSFTSGQVSFFVENFRQRPVANNSVSCRFDFTSYAIYITCHHSNITRHTTRTPHCTHVRPLLSYSPLPPRRRRHCWAILCAPNHLEAEVSNTDPST